MFLTRGPTYSDSFYSVRGMPLYQTGIHTVYSHMCSRFGLMLCIVIASHGQRCVGEESRVYSGCHLSSLCHCHWLFEHEYCTIQHLRHAAQASEYTLLSLSLSLSVCACVCVCVYVCVCVCVLCVCVRLCCMYSRRSMSRTAC